MNTNILLLVQVAGLVMAYNRSEELFQCSKPKLIGRLVIVFLPLLLFINLQFISKTSVVF